MNFKPFIKSLEMFKNCSEKIIAELVPLFREDEYKEETLVFEENSVGENIYIIYSGKIAIIKNYGKSNQKLLSILSEGEIFGEMGLFSAIKRSATAISKTESKLLSINSQEFKKVFIKYPEDGIKIIEWLLYNMGSRLEQTSKELAAINTISYLIINSLNEEDGLKRFLTKVCSEIYNIIEVGSTVAIYVYNIFLEEFELISICGEDNNFLKKSYDKNDEFISKLLFNNENCGMISECGRNCILFPMINLQNFIGFVVITNKNFLFSQRMKDMVSSITNLLSVSTVSLQQIQEEREKQKFKDMKSRLVL